MAIAAAAAGCVVVALAVALSSEIFSERIGGQV
jgi:hypothetical protein